LLNKFFFFLIFSSNLVEAQGDSASFEFDTLTLIKEIHEYKATAIYMTKTQQLIVQTVDNEIIKIDSMGKPLIKYTNKYLGTPEFIYLENPLQMVLFYPSYQTIIILDQWMNELKRVALNDLRIPFVSTIGISQDRSIWYYDDQVKRLKKINIDGLKSFESNLFITEDNADWQSIVVRKTDLFMQAKSGTIYLLNLFGQLKTKSFIDADIFNYNSDRLMAINVEKKIIYFIDQYSLNSIDQYFLPASFGKTTSIQFIRDFIYQLDENGFLRVWKRY
jgi:hypothetical protein